MSTNQNSRPLPADKINSQHFQRATAGELRAVEAGELRDVSAHDLAHMYLPATAGHKNKGR